MEIITDRINLFVKYLNISKNEFGKNIGVSSSLISQITTKKNNFRADIIQKISEAYPQLNIYWLLSGNGEMLNINHNNTPQVDTQHSKIDIAKTVQEAKASIATKPPLGMSYNGFYDENKQDFYFRHPEKRIDKMLVAAIDSFKQAFNDFYKLISVSDRLGAPDFMKEKFNKSKTYKEYKNGVDEDLSEEYADIEDKFYLKCIKLVAYENQVEHWRDAISQLIYYMDRYCDTYNDKDIS